MVIGNCLKYVLQILYNIKRNLLLPLMAATVTSGKVRILNSSFCRFSENIRASSAGAVDR